jgi:hypothetical protein
MSVSASSSTISSQVWPQFLTKADSNADGVLNSEELAAVSGDGQSAGSIAQMITAFDQDGDGQIGLTELTANPFPEHLQTMLLIQEEGGMDREAEITFKPTSYLAGEGRESARPEDIGKTGSIGTLFNSLPALEQTEELKQAIEDAIAYFEELK